MLHCPHSLRYSLLCMRVHTCNMSLLSMYLPVCLSVCLSNCFAVCLSSGGSKGQIRLLFEYQFVSLMWHCVLIVNDLQFVLFRFFFDDDNNDEYDSFHGAVLK